MRNRASYDEKSVGSLEEIKNKSQATVDELSRKANEVVNDVSNKIKDSADNISKDVKEYGNEFYDVIQKHPGKSLMLAATIGALGALFMKR